MRCSVRSLLYLLCVRTANSFLAPRVDRQRRCSSQLTTNFAGPSSEMPVVVLNRGKARLFRDGESLVYGGAVSHVEGGATLPVGTLVSVSDGAGNTIGWGAFNAESMFRVRLLWLSSDNSEHGASLSALLASRIRTAVRKRRRIGLPNKDTNAYRLWSISAEYIFLSQFPCRKQNMLSGW